MDQIIQSVTHEAVLALAAGLAWLLGEAIRRTRLGSKIATRDMIEKTAMSIALGVEEHFASRMKANPSLQITAKDKAEKFIADLVDQIPGTSRETAQAIAEQTLPKVGLGAAAGFQMLTRSLTSGAPIT